jgi:hypothetical protein
MPARVKYRITSVLKVETDINTCITTSPMGRAMIQVTMLVNTFKTDFILLGMACAWPYQSQYAE